jgi:hypothetical protein
MAGRAASQLLPRSTTCDIGASDRIFLIEGSTREGLPAMTIFAASAKAEPSGRMSYAWRLFFGRAALGHLTRSKAQGDYGAPA